MRFLKAACRLASTDRQLFFWLLIVVFLLTANACTDKVEAVPVYKTALAGKDSADFPPSFGLGRPATDSEIAAWDIDISPDGKGLPVGSGNVTTGRNIYALKCAACHGKTG